MCRMLSIAVLFFLIESNIMIISVGYEQPLDAPQLRHVKQAPERCMTWPHM